MFWEMVERKDGLKKEIESKNISHRIKLVGRHPQSKMLRDVLKEQMPYWFH